MWQVMVAVSLVLSAKGPYALLPRKSHTHKIALGSSLHLPLGGPAQELLLTGPGMLQVSARRHGKTAVRVYVREAGAIDEVVALVDVAQADVVVTISVGPHTVQVLADADVPGAIVATYATWIAPKPPPALAIDAPPTPQNEPPAALAADSPEPREALPTPQISTPPLAVKGRPDTARLDSVQTVFIVKPKHALRLVIVPHTTSVHLVFWRTLGQASTHIVVHVDGHVMMSAVLDSAQASDHLDGEAAVAIAEDLLVEPPPGARQMVIDSDAEVGVVVGR